MGEIISFIPIADNKSKVLVLGTIPGPESLKQGEYYANPRNQFWDIIYGIFDLVSDLNYKQKVDFLLDKRIALWDVSECCTRDGSLDSSIKDSIPNDISSFLKMHPNIEYIVFNGTTAKKLFKKSFRMNFDHICEYTVLPSTSPTPGRYVLSYASKLSKWKIILDFLD